MGQIAEIESRFNALAGGLQLLGIDLAPSLENVGRAPQATCINNGIVIEFLLRDLWKRLAIKGSPRQKSIEELLTQVLRVLEESDAPMPRRVHDKIRGVQTTRNRAAHHAPDEITEEDAIESLQQLADVTNWYFARYLPDATAIPPVAPTKQPSSPAAPALSPLRIAILYKRKRQPDENVLNWLETQLRAGGHHVFIDRHLAIGEEWAREIARQIRESDVVIPLLSEDSVNSEMISYEVKLAHDAAQVQNGKPRLLPVRVEFTAPLPDEMAGILDSLQYFLWEGPQDNQQLIDKLTGALLNPMNPVESRPAVPRPTLEQEGGAVPLESHFYIVRPVDNAFYQAIGRRDSILLLKGARQMGKTSLLSRALEQARGSGLRVTVTDFQKLNAAHLASPRELFIALGSMIALQLDLDVFPPDVWREHLGPNDNFERYLRREVLAKSPVPLVWAMDEVDRLFVCPFASEVFGLFRSWHNARALEPSGPWRNLTLAIVYATEAHLFITDMNQSPFNVGTRLALDDFTFEQVGDLNQRYGSPLPSDAAVARFFRLIGGQPYLTRRGLREMADRQLDIAVIEDMADRDEGPFGDHLRRILVSVSQKPELSEAVRMVFRGRPCTDQNVFYRLRSAGILVGETAREARPRCQLYANYLERHLLG